MTAPLSLNNIVPVTLVLSATAQAAPSFNAGLVLTHATNLPPGGRVQSFTSAADVLAAFPADTYVNYFSSMYFGQDNHKPKSLLVGVKVAADTDYTAAISACANANPAFYGVACSPDVAVADQLLVAAWVQANGRRFFCCTQEAAVLSQPDTTSLMYTLSHTSMSRSMCIYSDAASDAHAVAHAALMAFYMFPNYDQPNSLMTCLQANFTGIGAASITQTQFDAICGKTDGSTVGLNGNVYSMIGSSKVLQRGLAADGRFEDEGIALDWLAANLQVDYFNVLRSQRVPQTDKGSQTIINGGLATLRKAVRNGLAAPGVWSFPGFGNLNQGDYVPQGFYCYAQPVTSMTAGDRAARKAPAISVALVGAGALQYIAPTIIFQR
jgi:hypothetical protein